MKVTNKEQGSNFDLENKERLDIEAIEEIAYLMLEAKKKKLPKPIIFLGAGASVSSGIPLTGKIVADVKLKYKDKPSVKKLIDENINDYYKVMEALTADERRDLFYAYITHKNVKINVTNIYLAQLLSEEYIDFVLTVNFDDLILRACALFNFLPPVYDISNVKVPTTSNFREKSVIYLHGQHFGQWLLNCGTELGKIENVIPNVFNEIKNRRTWIVVGYSGNDEILTHIKNLGSFTNNLYWINYLNSEPEEKVKELIGNPDANATLISGFDSDSFFLKLHSILVSKSKDKLVTPEIIEKPFSALKKTLDNIVSIQDKEHFKEVKERFEITKAQVAIAIEQFETGKPENQNNLKEIEVILLKKKIIDIMIKSEYKLDEIKLLENEANSIDVKEINDLMSNLYNNWGNNIFHLAKDKNNLSLYEDAIAKYLKCIKFNPQNENVNFNMGLTYIQMGRLKKNDPNLYKKSFEQFKKAANFKSEKRNPYHSWAIAISDLAKMQSSEKLFKQSFEKYKLASEKEKTNGSIYYNWGTALLDLAKLTGKEQFLNQSIETLDKSFKNGGSTYNLACAYALKKKNRKPWIF